MKTNTTVLAGSREPLQASRSNAPTLRPVLRSSTAEGGRSPLHALLPLALAVITTLLTNTTFAQPWQTVDDYQSVPGYDSLAFAITKDPAGNLYTAGQAADAQWNYHALVMKSSDGGTTWSTIDSFSNGDATPG